MSTRPDSLHPDDEGEIVAPDTGSMDRLTRSEITLQQEYAKHNPRSLATFKKRCFEIVTLDQDTAKECFYSLPRNERDQDGGVTKKMIMGPSARLAEVVVSCWGNCRAAARVVGEDENGEFIRAQGTFHDLESNYAVCFEVKRRITGRNGKKFNADMVGVTGNAAASIAFRNAVFKGVPKALWNTFYKAAMKTAVGDLKTLDAKRKEQVATLNKMGIPNDVLFGVLEINGMDDILADQLLELQGLENAIREGDTTVDDVIAGWARQRLEGGGSVRSRTEAMPDSISRPSAATAATSTQQAPAQDYSASIKQAEEALAKLRAEQAGSVVPKSQPPAEQVAAPADSSEPPKDTGTTSSQEDSHAAEQRPLMSPSASEMNFRDPDDRPRRRGR